MKIRITWNKEEAEALGQWSAGREAIVSLFRKRWPELGEIEVVSALEDSPLAAEWDEDGCFEPERAIQE